MESLYIGVVVVLVLCCTITHFKSKVLKKHVYVDFLTGLYNRKILPQIEGNEKNGIKYFVIACDIDHFKSVNDNYGHAVGDLVLKTVSETIKGLFKSNLDYVVRFGGEEFFIFMRESEESIKIIESRTEYLRLKIQELNILTEDMKLIKVTSSFGICLNTGISLEKRIEASDAKLYESKTSGRNKVSI